MSDKSGLQTKKRAETDSLDREEELLQGLVPIRMTTETQRRIEMKNKIRSDGVIVRVMISKIRSKLVSEKPTSIVQLWQVLVSYKSQVIVLVLFAVRCVQSLSRSSQSPMDPCQQFTVLCCFSVGL